MRFFSLPIILLAMTPLWACSSPGGSASGSKQESSAGSTGLLASTSIPSADYEKIRSRFCAETLALGNQDPFTQPLAFLDSGLSIHQSLGPIVPSNVAADYKDALQYWTIVRDLNAQYPLDKVARFADPRFSEATALQQALDAKGPLNTWLFSLC